MASLKKPPTLRETVRQLVLEAMNVETYALDPVDREEAQRALDRLRVLADFAEEQLGGGS